MGKKFLIDTNILIGFQSASLPPAAHSLVASIIDEDFNVSIINKIELLGHNSVTQSTEDFIELARVFELDASVAETTIAIRKHYKTKLPDAIIAATAIVNNCTLVTQNVSDFKKIKGLLILDPFKKK